jgi:N6-L-threonylcarbamoyladenine synthase
MTSLFAHQPPMILAIDTSCDDTAAAVVCGRQVLSNIVASQVQLHKPYGGVYPTIAKQAHRENWPTVVKLALQRAGVTWKELSALAVTVGPGLAPALEIGILAAQQLTKEHNLPLIAVNHIEAHAWSALAVAKPTTEKVEQTHSDLAEPTWPVLAVIVSGGHTLFVSITGFGKYQILGQTLDDAAGECLDKVGRMISLGYPAGPVVETFAKLGNPDKFTFPLPMTTSGDFNLSFSGLKTHARNVIEKITTTQQLDQQTTYDLCASLQKGVFHHITHKLTKLLDRNAASNTPFHSVWLGGGVAANMTLRATLRETLKPYGLKLAVPYSKRLCGDNAAMIGLIGALKFAQDQIETEPEKLERQPRLTLGV